MQGILEAGGRFGLAPKTFQMRLSRPMAEGDHLQGDDPVQALLAGAIDDALTATTDFLQQLVIAELSQGRLTGRSVPSLSKLRPVSKRRAGQYPDGPSAKIVAPHLSQSLGAAVRRLAGVNFGHLHS